MRQRFPWLKNNSLCSAVLLFLALSGFGCENKEQVRIPDPPSFNAATISSLQDKELENAVIDYVSYRIGNDYANEHKIVAALPKGFQAVYATYWVEAEVGSSGFREYFGDSAGVFHHEALEGYRILGAVEHEAVMAEAVGLYRQEEARPKAVATPAKDPLAVCDDKFRDLKEDSAALRIRLIREHPELFAVK